MKLSLILATATLVVGTQSWARSTKTEVNTVLLGQGVSSPAVNTSVNFSNGYTHQNSAVAASLSGFEVTGEYQTTEDNAGNKTSAYGGELGFGNGKAGVVAGYYKNDCSGCEGRVGAIAGLNLSKVGIGVGYREKDTISAGFLFNPMGQHRIGLTFDTQNKDTAGNDFKSTSYALGYTVDAKNWAFPIDASKHDGVAYTQDRKDLIQLTPGFMFHASFITVTLDYDMYLNDKNDIAKDQFWGGLGVGNDKIQFAVYHKYAGQDWTGSLSFWF